jgi:hypothetical protein
LDLEIFRELEAVKSIVILRFQQLRYEELQLALKNANRKDKSTRLKIAHELKALQYTPAVDASLMTPLEEIQSRVDALLVRLEDRESDLLLQFDQSISSALCELTRQSFLQHLRQFECGLTLSKSDDADETGDAGSGEGLRNEMAALERKNLALEQNLAALLRKQGVGLKVGQSLPQLTYRPFSHSVVSLCRLSLSLSLSLSLCLSLPLSVSLSLSLGQEPHVRLDSLTSPSRILTGVFRNRSVVCDLASVLTSHSYSRIFSHRTRRVS